MEQKSASKRTSVLKIRVGVLLWVVSYLPLPFLLVYVLHNHDEIKSPSSTSEFLAVSWGIQFIIGLIGLVVAGRETITLLRHQSIRQLPKAFWRLLWNGSIPDHKDQHQSSV